MLLKKRKQMPPQPGQVVVLNARVQEVNKKAYHASHSYEWGREKRSIHLKEASRYLVLRHFGEDEKMFYAIPIEHVSYKGSTSMNAFDTLFARARRIELLMSSDSVRVVSTFDQFIENRFTNTNRQEVFKEDMFSKARIKVENLTF